MFNAFLKTKKRNNIKLIFKITPILNFVPNEQNQEKLFPAEENLVYMLKYR